MSGPGMYLFFTGLIMFAIGLILLISLNKQHHRWWIWLLLFLGLLILIWGVGLWFMSGFLSSQPQGQGGFPFAFGKTGAAEAEAEAGEASLLSEAELLALL